MQGQHSPLELPTPILSRTDELARVGISGDTPPSGGDAQAAREVCYYRTGSLFSCFENFRGDFERDAICPYVRLVLLQAASMYESFCRRS